MLLSKLHCSFPCFLILWISPKSFKHILGPNYMKCMTLVIFNTQERMHKFGIFNEIQTMWNSKLISIKPKIQNISRSDLNLKILKLLDIILFSESYKIGSFLNVEDFTDHLVFPCRLRGNCSIWQLVSEVHAVYIV